MLFWVETNLCSICLLDIPFLCFYKNLETRHSHSLKSAPECFNSLHVWGKQWLCEANSDCGNTPCLSLNRTTYSTITAYIDESKLIVVHECLLWLFRYSLRAIWLLLCIHYCPSIQCDDVCCYDEFVMFIWLLIL